MEAEDVRPRIAGSGPYLIGLVLSSADWSMRTLAKILKGRQWLGVSVMKTGDLLRGIC